MELRSPPKGGAWDEDAYGLWRIAYGKGASFRVLAIRHTPASNIGGQRMEKQSHREAGKPAETTRRPYERPAVSWEEDFEPYIFSMCGKMAGSGGACTFSRRS